MDQHIVALGGAGFGGEFGPRLNDYLVSLARRSNPRVCFVPTAVGDSDGPIVDFYRWFAPDRCRKSHLPLFHRDIEDLRAYLLEQDVIYVCGGNTANMLAIWRVHGLDVILREAWEAGIVLCGGSAGSLCWFECGITDSFGPTLAPLYDGLGFLAGSNCPHYDGEEQRRPTYHRCIVEGLPGGFAAEDFVGLHFIGTELAEVVTGREGSRAYRVELAETGVIETPLEARYLG